MNPLSSLRSLVTKLRKEEIKSLILFLNHQLPNPKEDSKSAQLVKILLDDTQYGAKDIQKVLYGKSNDSAFYKLVARLKDKILEVMLFNQHLESESYNQRNRVVFTLRKKLLEVDVLFNRGVVEEVEDRLIAIKKDAVRLELYDILFQSNSTLRRYYITRSRSKQVEDVSREIAFYKKSEFLYDQAVTEFNRMMNRINFSFTNKDYLTDLELLTRNLDQWFKETKSTTIGYYFLLLKLEYCQTSKDYIAADACLEELGQLLTLNESFNTPARYGTYILNKANNHLYLRRFDEVESLVNQAIDNFKGSELNIALSYEVLFYSCFYQKDITACKRILEQVKLSYRIVDSTLVNRFKYYQAVLLFKLQNYSEALNELESLPELSRDKEGWNVARKILQVLCRVEQGDYDSVDLSVLNLQKYLKRVQRQKHLNIRYSLILKIMLKLINESFNYELTFKSRLKYFKELENEKGEAGWRIKSPELIVFNDWFMSKLLSTSSRPAYNQQHL